MTKWRAAAWILVCGAGLSAQSSEASPQIALKGLMKVEGISYRQGQSTKYTGDTYLLKLEFRDEKGALYQPTPALNFVVYNGKEPYKKVQRLVTKEQWKADVTQINQQTVADNTIACDKKTGELWVAFVRVDSGFDPRIDLTLEIKRVGTWVWKGIDLDSKFETPAKGPDKK